MNLFNKIYDLTFLPLVTPSNLLDNLNLENYKSINYLKQENGLIAEVNCIVDDRNMVFFYEFNDKNYLQLIYYFDNNIKEILFNRDDLLENLRDKFNNSSLRVENM